MTWRVEERQSNGLIKYLFRSKKTKTNFDWQSRPPTPSSVLDERVGRRRYVFKKSVWFVFILSWCEAEISLWSIRGIAINVRLDRTRRLTDIEVWLVLKACPSFFCLWDFISLSCSFQNLKYSLLPVVKPSILKLPFKSKVKANPVHIFGSKDCTVSGFILYQVDDGYQNLSSLSFMYMMLKCPILPLWHHLDQGLPQENLPHRLLAREEDL